jgi:hypothetical protein
LATSLGLSEVAVRLEESFTLKDSIDFVEYLEFLRDALFSKLDSGVVDDLSSNVLDQVDEVCWLICAKNHCSATPGQLKYVETTKHRNV